MVYTVVPYLDSLSVVGLESPPEIREPNYEISILVHFVMLNTVLYRSISYIIVL